MSAEEPSFTIYFDTNVISYVSVGKVPDFLGILTDRGHRLVVSDTVLEELPSGRETRTLLDHGFLYVLAHEASFLGGLVNFYRSIEPDNNSVNVDAIELFLRGILRSIAGSTSVPDLNVLFRNAMEDVVQAMMEDLPENTDLRIIAQLEFARERFSQELRLLPAVPSPIVTKDELEAHHMAPKQINNIKPPSVVKKITAIYPVLTEWLEPLISPFTEQENIKSRIQELCLALIGMGFARDKDIGKNDQRKSDSGARAQFGDISQICAASVCDIFVTSDRRCARLAFAAFEALNLRTVIFHLLPGNVNEVNLRLVGEGYWP
ncbi:hypothetical protein [Tabrizicola sp.]|uniref:hypothetical protein n=1 Tax=Tabrizicola sp. TaxID=2005166 RepID=UPI002FDD7FE0